MRYSIMLSRAKNIDVSSFSIAEDVSKTTIEKYSASYTDNFFHVFMKQK